MTETPCRRGERYDRVTGTKHIRSGWRGTGAAPICGARARSCLRAAARVVLSSVPSSIVDQPPSRRSAACSEPPAPKPARQFAPEPLKDSIGVGRCRGLLLTVALATVTTIAIAWPVVTNPRELAYGHEIDGRHHDAYTVMQQIAGSGVAEPYAQPLTDRFGRLFARVLNPVAAYNLLVLLSFPLTAATTYALARHLTASHEAALVAAFVFTFAPVRLAHAAYHPHIVQTQWLPLYLLALVALIERASWPRVLGVGARMRCVGTLELLQRIDRRSRDARDARRVLGGATDGLRLEVAGDRPGDRDCLRRRRPDAGCRAVSPGRRQPVAIRLCRQRRGAVQRALVGVLRPVSRPPACRRLGGGAARKSGEAQSIVEQQIYLGYAVLVLAAIATATAVARWRKEPQWRPIVSIVAVGIAAALVSLGPFSRSCETGSWAPACLVYQVAPMFRSYARFAIVVNLAVAIAAGSGAVILARRSRTGLGCGREPARHRRRRILAVSLAGARRASDGRAPLAGPAAGAGAIFDCSPAAGKSRRCHG